MICRNISMCFVCMPSPRGKNLLTKSATKSSWRMFKNSCCANRTGLVCLASKSARVRPASSIFKSVKTRSSRGWVAKDKVTAKASLESCSMNCRVTLLIFRPCCCEKDSKPMSMSSGAGAATGIFSFPKARSQAYLNRRWGSKAATTQAQHGPKTVQREKVGSAGIIVQNSQTTSL